jgi:hypothetical protein
MRETALNPAARSGNACKAGMTLLKHDPSAQSPRQKAIAGQTVECIAFIPFWLRSYEGKLCFRQ